MNKLLLIIVILISNFTTAQITKAGNFYELDKLWKKDSVSVKQLLVRFDLDVSKLKPLSFFKDFDLNLELHENYTYKSYLYKMNKNTGDVSMKSYHHEGKKPMMNKYVMIVCFDAFSGDKSITIKVF
jgi:hypothetical protein